MGFFSRLATFFRIRAESALNRAEDPGQVMDYSYGKQFEQQIAQLREQETRLVTMERQISSRVEAFRTQKEMVKAQYGAAQAQVKINEAVTGISQEMSEMNLAMQRAQDKVLSMQARANAMDALIEQGTLGEQGLLGPGSNDPLERELHQISAQQNVEAQLQAMKQQMQLGGSKSQPRQLEGPDNY